MNYHEWKIKRMREVHAMLGSPKPPAPDFLGSLPSGESDPSVTPDCSGAGAGHQPIIGLQGKWVCQRCGDPVEMGVAFSQAHQNPEGVDK